MSYDLIVIGAGPGGYVAAIRAAQLGMRVACVEKQYLGGTCLNVGCIPSKALLDSSEKYAEARLHLAEHGVRAGDLRLDLPTMMARKDKIVQGLTSGVGGLFRKHKIEHLRGSARIISPSSVEIRSSDGQTQTLSGVRILIATGSEPAALPQLPFDGRHILSSTQALALPEVPARLLVVGAGAIGLELGSVWCRLGAQVLVVEFMDRILPLMDREMTAALHRLLEKQGMQFSLKTSATAARSENNQVHVTLQPQGGQAAVQTVDRVLVAVGRRPHTSGLGLEALGVKTDAKGFIQVDRHFATSVAGIHAIGDVIGGAMLAHKAEEEGIAAVEHIAGKGGHVNYRAVANVVYTHPELASVGLGEEEAQRGGQIKVGRFPFAANGRARALGESAGLVKIVADARSDRLLGMHILGPRASDLIAEGAVAIEMAASAEDIARSVHAHPTLTEAIKEAALGVESRPIHL